MKPMAHCVCEACRGDRLSPFLFMAAVICVLLSGYLR